MLTLLTIMLLGKLLAGADENPFRPEPPPPATDARPDDGRTNDAAAVEVELVSGEVLRAELDPRTDAARLWLVFCRDRMSLARAMPWDEVRRVKLAGQELTAEQCRELVQKVRAELPPPSARQRIVLAGDPAFAADERKPAATAAPAPRVQWLDIDAALGQWDANVQADGIVLYVQPRDAAGELLPVSGTLVAELFGERSGVVRHPQPFVSLGQWTRTLRPGDFGPRGAMLRLEFQNVHPEFVAELLPRGALHVRLSVPGQGTFEASDAMLRIRPYSSVRDRMQLYTGRRFFPGENVGP